MKKLTSPPKNTLGASLSKILYRFHIVLFVVVVVGGMAVVMFMLNQTITRATDTSQMIQPVAERFDQATIDRLNKLEVSGTQKDISFPQGRINPFSE